MPTGLGESCGRGTRISCRYRTARAVQRRSHPPPTSNIHGPHDVTHCEKDTWNEYDSWMALFSEVTVARQHIEFPPCRDFALTCMRSSQANVRSPRGKCAERRGKCVERRGKCAEPTRQICGATRQICGAKRQICGAIGQKSGAISEFFFGCWMCRSGRVIDQSTAVIMRLQASITDQILEHSGDGHQNASLPKSCFSIRPRKYSKTRPSKSFERLATSAS